jgi:hypothetical protein
MNGCNAIGVHVKSSRCYLSLDAYLRQLSDCDFYEVSPIVALILTDNNDYIDWLGQIVRQQLHCQSGGTL